MQECWESLSLLQYPRSLFIHEIAEKGVTQLFFQLCFPVSYHFLLSNLLTKIAVPVSKMAIKRLPLVHIFHDYERTVGTGELQ